MARGYDKLYMDITLEFLGNMAVEKKKQVECEPDEPMWKEELTQLERTIGLVEMEKESIENGQ